jgi:hypothetical protein
LLVCHSFFAELERERPLGCFIAKLLGEPTNDTKNQLAGVHKRSTLRLQRCAYGLLGNLAFLLRKKYGSAFDRTLIDIVIACTPSGWCSILLYNGELVIRGNVTPNRNGIGESLFATSAKAVAMVLQ